ncbi:MAG: hypothetical protein ABGX83_03820 [Nitrospira sp.]|nr:hypothetical protein [Candidatus Manganitrophaceae bacterium]HIL35398.1 hypothetical protein [Candidatus Manganitrophaceae bacterium]
MNTLRRFFTVTSLVIISVLFLMTYTLLARELPLLLDVSELGEKYDNRRVTVMGWARSAVLMRGRMGSSFVSATVGEGGDEVTVFSDFPNYNMVNSRVIVQGVYHHEGRFGGLPTEHFIVADAVVRDWGASDSPTPSPSPRPSDLKD